MSKNFTRREFLDKGAKALSGASFSYIIKPRFYMSKLVWEFMRNYERLFTHGGIDGLIDYDPDKKQGVFVFDGYTPKTRSRITVQAKDDKSLKMYIRPDGTDGPDNRVIIEDRNLNDRVDEYIVYGGERVKEIFLALFPPVPISVSFLLESEIINSSFNGKGKKFNIQEYYERKKERKRDEITYGKGEEEQAIQRLYTATLPNLLG